MIYDKLPIIFKLEERTLTSTFLFIHIFGWLSLLVRLFQIERKNYN